MSAVVLTSEVEQRLDRVVELTGRNRADLVTEAILAHLDDLEDIAGAELALADTAAGRSRSTPLDEVVRELGSAD